jgi:hypothetical protein
MSFIECTAMSILPREHVVLDLAGEETLAADLLQRAVQHLVPGRLDDDDVERLLGQVEGLRQPVACLVRLGKRQGRAAGADAEGAGGGREIECHGRSISRVTRALQRALS